MKKKLTYILTLILLILLIISIIKKYQTNKSIKNLKNQKQIVQKYNKIDELRKYYNNDNIQGILRIKNLDLTTILTKYTDNDYYLKHDIRNNYDIYGNPFIDYRTNLTDKKVIIYGHSDNKENVPFAKLIKYLDYNTYQNNKEITIETNKIKTYKIFAIDIITNSDPYHIDLSTKNQKFKDNSIYKIDETITDEDNIITLQTCLYGKYKNKYLIISAKEV